MTNPRPDDIVCFEIGSGDEQPWVGSRCALATDLDALHACANRGVIHIDVVGDRVFIRGATRVGLVILPSGRRLIIRSKIPGMTLLQWLVYLEQFPQLTSWLPEAGISSGSDVQECIARLFVCALEHVTRRHMRREYTTLQAAETQIRGRILVTALSRQLHRLPQVPQLQRRRTLDTPSNVALALALDRLPVLLTNQEDLLRRVAQLREQWSPISRHKHDPIAALILAQHSCPPGYRAALQLARLILIGAAIDDTSKSGGQAFTLPLAIVWERALCRMFDELANETGWRRLGKRKRRRPWNDPVGRNDEKRWLVADMIVERRGSRWVLDTKYKCDFGDEGRIDRFQICAYSIAFDAERASLVYPTHVEQSQPVRELLSPVVNGRILQIDSIGLPMFAGPERCREALASVIHETAN